MHINIGKMKINRKSENNSQAKTILKKKFRVSTEKKNTTKSEKISWKNYVSVEKRRFSLVHVSASIMKR